MPKAFVLFNTEIGAENEVISALKKVEGIDTAKSLWGIYDIIATIKADSIEKLTNIIRVEIEKIHKIHSKVAMIITEQPESLVADQKPPLS